MNNLKPPEEKVRTPHLGGKPAGSLPDVEQEEFQLPAMAYEAYLT